MRKEAKIALGLTAAVLALEASKFALTTPARKEAGKRDHWTCQGINNNGCSMKDWNEGQPLSFQDGFMVVLAHYPETHHLSGRGFHDPNPENARTLCVVDHAAEEIMRGNEFGALKQLQMGFYHWNHLRDAGVDQIHFSLDDLRKWMEEHPEHFRWHEPHRLPAHP